MADMGVNVDEKRKCCLDEKTRIAHSKYLSGTQSVDTLLLMLVWKVKCLWKCSLCIVTGPKIFCMARKVERSIECSLCNDAGS